MNGRASCGASDLQNLSALTRARIEEVLSRHAGPTSLSLPGAQVRILSVQPISQDGPQCGLVALSMATQLLGLEKKDVLEIYETAKRMGLTIQGEMFSAHWLKQLATSLWPLHCEVLGMPEPSTLVSWIDSGAAVLVAYDCEKNHEPAMRNGWGAHWAVLVGYLYVEAYTSAIRSAADFSVDDEHAFYVFAFHGKSRHMGLWSYSILRRSSFNLLEAGPERKPPHYLLPDDGLAQLRGKCVVLRKTLLSDSKQ